MTVASTVPRRRTVIWLGLTLCAALFGYFIWPTPYRYDQMKRGSNSFPVRTNRFTGNSAILYPSGWSVVGDVEDDVELPAEVLSQLEVQHAATHITDYGWVKCTIYNGSKWTVGSLILSVSVTDQSGRTIVARRPYLLTTSPALPPQRSGEFIAGLGFTLQPGQTWSCQIVGAKGEKR